MSEDIIKHLREELERTISQRDEARKEAAKNRVEKSGKVKTLEEQLAASLKENEKISKKLETLPGELQAENDRLKGEIRTRDHKGKFNEVAKELKVRPEAIDDLFNLSGYKAEGDEVNVDAIKEAIAKSLEARPYLIDGTESQQPAPARPGPGAGKGPRPTDHTGFTQTYSQAADPEFQMSHRAEIQAAAMRGELKTVPDRI